MNTAMRRHSGDDALQGAQRDVEATSDAFVNAVANVLAAQVAIERQRQDVVSCAEPRPRATASECTKSYELVAMKILEWINGHEQRSPVGVLTRCRSDPSVGSASPDFILACASGRVVPAWSCCVRFRFSVLIYSLSARARRARKSHASHVAPLASPFVGSHASGVATFSDPWFETFDIRSH